MTIEKIIDSIGRFLPNIFKKPNEIIDNRKNKYSLINGQSITMSNNNKLLAIPIVKWEEDCLYMLSNKEWKEDRITRKDVLDRMVFISSKNDKE